MDQDFRPLITKYRPETWDQFYGNESTVAALRRKLKDPSCSHAFLLSGRSGTGKTTLARLIAKELKAEIIENDAGALNGIDNVRTMIETGAHLAFRANGRRMFILNEVHAYSKAAWNALLTTLEEPPDHLYFALTTTDIDRVPDAVKTRSYPIPLSIVSNNDLILLIREIAAEEGWKINSDVLNAVVSASTGQPRKALAFIQAVHDAKNVDELYRIAAIEHEGETVIELIRLLIQDKAKWADVRKLLLAMEDKDFDEVFIIAGRYISGALLKSENVDQACRMLGLLDHLTQPIATFDRKVAFHIAVGRMMWGKKNG